jgi:hypothetical protein
MHYAVATFSPTPLSFKRGKRGVWTLSDSFSRLYSLKTPLLPQQ